MYIEQHSEGVTAPTIDIAHIMNTSVTMTLKQAGDQLGVHAETVRRMAVDEEIPSARIRKRWAIPTLFVLDWTSGNRQMWSKGSDGLWHRAGDCNSAEDKGPEFRKSESTPIPPGAD
jgi:excisionase family DNA binding protein